MVIRIQEHGKQEGIRQSYEYNFIMESLAIERIFREPTEEELQEHTRFMRLSKITVEDLEIFVSIYEPAAKLRNKAGMNVSVGRHTPPFGGMKINYMLVVLLDRAQNSPKLPAYETHLEYERIHPFTDCNGRSGRILWLWLMRGYNHNKALFLQNFYYQTLAKNSDRVSKEIRCS